MLTGLMETRGAHSLKQLLAQPVLVGGAHHLHPDVVPHLVPVSLGAHVLDVAHVGQAQVAGQLRGSGSTICDQGCVIVR